MGLESVTNIDELVVTNPTATDLRSTADDHIRIIKVALTTLLENVPGVKDGTPATLGIVAGAIEPTVAVQYVDTEAAADSDDLDTITATNIYTGGFLWLRAANTARTVVVKHGTGNIALRSGDVSLDSTDMWMLLIYDGSNYIELLTTILAPGITIADAASTLSSQSGQASFITPTAARILTLPTTGIKIGHEITIVNLATDDNFLTTINASGGAAKAIFVNGSIKLRANQAAPTTPAHWDTIEPGVRGVLDDAAVTISAPGTYVGTPSVTRIWTLGSTFKVGERVTIVNLASDQKITVNASTGATKMEFQDGHVTFLALQNAPTTPAHWQIFGVRGGRSGVKGGNIQFTEVGNIGAGEDDLMSYTLPASTLTSDGKAVRIVAFGAVNHSPGRLLRIKFHFGSSSTELYNIDTISNAIWWLEVIVVRTGSNAQAVKLVFHRGTLTAIEDVSTTETDSSTIVIKVTGEDVNGSTNDVITQTLMLTEELN